jgi:predicted lipid-binding transport protein (Tim44 family)
MWVRLFGLARWAPLCLGVQLPALAWARIGGGEHYKGGNRSHPGSSFDGDGSGDLGGLVFYLFALGFEHPLLICPLLLTLGALFLFYQRSRDPSASTQRALEQREAQLRTQVSAADVTGWVNALKLRDPSFELLPMLDRTKKLFLEMQQAWLKRDLTPIRSSVSDATFQRLKGQLKLLEEQGIRDAFADIQIPDLQIIGLDQSNWFDTVHIRIRAQMKDLDVPITASDVETEQAARAAQPEAFTEVWSFVRKPGAKTRIGDELYQGKCPNCGAPYRGGATNNCDYCGAVLNSGNYDWTLAGITQGIEHVRGYPTVDGLLEAREGDPALNLEILEDRGSLIFWKWIEAQSCGDAKRLSKLCSAGYLARLDAELTGLHQQGRRKVFLECAVGTVITRLLRPAVGGYDEAHLEIRWSARIGIGPQGQKPPALPTVPQRWIFTLARRSGAITNALNGMSTSRCPQCSAPLTDTLSPVCDFCGEELASGARDWILAAANTFEGWHSLEDQRFQALTAGRDNRLGAEVITDVHERERLLYMMAAIASADGVIENRERKLLKLCSERWSIPWSKVEIALSAGPQLFDRLVPRGSPEAEAFLRGLVQMALVDGRIDRQERRMLQSAAERLGLQQRLQLLLAGK